MKISNYRGFTLTEVIAAVALVGLLGYGFTMAMLQFVTSYQETRDYIQLQQEMIETINIVRHGYITSRSSEVPLFGLLTAHKVTFNTERNSVRVAPLDADFVIPQWATYFHNTRDGTIRVSGMFRVTPKRNEIIFPRKIVMVGNESKFQIVHFEFEDVTEYGVFTSLVKLTITGRVRFRQARRGQSGLEDARQNVRYATFEVITFLGNSDKEAND
jgi:prepilin-type N-terminal cleavage/methylation domain-containing protein